MFFREISDFPKDSKHSHQKVLRQQLDNEAKCIDLSNASNIRCESDGYYSNTNIMWKRRKPNCQRKKGKVFLSVDGVDPAQIRSICLKDYNNDDEICWWHNRKCSPFF